MGEEPNGSLWGIANGGSIGTMMSGMGSPPPGGWTPALGDMILKVDGKFKVHCIVPFSRQIRTKAVIRK